MKKGICVSLLLGVLLIGAFSQVLAENNKAEGITSESSMSIQSEESFFSQDNLILLAVAQDKDKHEDKDKHPDRDKHQNKDKHHDKPKPNCTSFKVQACFSHWPKCCWVNSNSQSWGHCDNCQ
jgi:hypothetical protein